MRGVYYRTEKDGTPLATPELRISATNNRTVYYDNQNAKEAALQNNEIKEGSIVLTGYADGESEVLMKEQPDWTNKVDITAAKLATGYTAPADGIICISGTSPSNSVRGYIVINGIQVSSSIAGASVGYRESQTQIAVNEGDIIRTVDGNGNAQTWILHITSIFVPFKTVAEPLTLPVNVMNNPSLPDWSRAISITAAQLMSGYTAPANGFIVGNGAGTSAVTELSINNVICAVGTYSGGTYVRLNICATVQSGNIVKTSANLNTVCQISFVPFKN